MSRRSAELYGFYGAQRAAIRDDLQEPLMFNGTMSRTDQQEAPSLDSVITGRGGRRRREEEVLWAPPGGSWLHGGTFSHPVISDLLLFLWLLYLMTSGESLHL